MGAHFMETEELSIKVRWNQQLFFGSQEPLGAFVTFVHILDARQGKLQILQLWAA